MIIMHDSIQFGPNSQISENQFPAPGGYLFTLSTLIRKGQVVFGGNRQLKIYGRLNCKSGKRLKIKNRVFFTTEAEAIGEGYRPCAHCMKKEYEAWKNNNLVPFHYTEQAKME